MQHERLGDLDCIVVDTAGNDSPPAAVAIFCHGFGAPGTDLVPLASVLARSLGDQVHQLRFVFPAAPMSLDDQGDPRRSRLVADRHGPVANGDGHRDFRDLKNESPELLPEMNARIIQVIEESCERWDLPESKLILGGFLTGRHADDGCRAAFAAAAGGVGDLVGYAAG